MNQRAFVTIIIPNYNHETFLQQRIESVLNQSFQDFELYLLDDCSTDSSKRVIDQYKEHPKVKGVYINSSNSGSLFKQWVKGIKLSEGKYLWIAESDDYAHEDFLKETVALAESIQSVGLVFSDSMVVDASGNIIGQASESNKLLFSLKDKQHFKIDDRNKALNYFVSDLIIWNASSVLFLTEAIKRVDFNLLQTLKNAGDLFTYISIALKYDIVFLNKPLNNFRKHDGNATIKNLKSGALYKDRLRIIQYHLDELKELANAQEALRKFISRHFLTALDFKFHKNIQYLLNAYLSFNLLSYSSYLSLSLYVCCNKYFYKVPGRYRIFIKKVLEKKA